LAGGVIPDQITPLKVVCQLLRLPMVMQSTSQVKLADSMAILQPPPSSWTKGKKQHLELKKRHTRDGWPLSEVGWLY
jgi:hypothetical protein